MSFGGLMRCFGCSHRVACSRRLLCRRQTAWSERFKAPLVGSLEVSIRSRWPDCAWHGFFTNRRECFRGACNSSRFGWLIKRDRGAFVSSSRMLMLASDAISAWNNHDNGRPRRPASVDAASQIAIGLATLRDSGESSLNRVLRALPAATLDNRFGCHS